MGLSTLAQAQELSPIILETVGSNTQKPYSAA